MRSERMMPPAGHPVKVLLLRGAAHGTPCTALITGYNYWNTPYFLSRAGAIGPNTRVLIQRVIEKFAYPVQSYRSCFGILRFAEKYGKEALENCCRDSVLYGKCSYNYVANPRLIVVANNQMLPAFKNGQIIWRSHQALKFAKSR